MHIYICTYVQVCIYCIYIYTRVQKYMHCISVYLHWLSNLLPYLTRTSWLFQREKEPSTPQALFSLMLKGRLSKLRCVWCACLAFLPQECNRGVGMWLIRFNLALPGCSSCGRRWARVTAIPWDIVSWHIAWCLSAPRLPRLLPPRTMQNKLIWGSSLVKRKADQSHNSRSQTTRTLRRMWMVTTPHPWLTTPLWHLLRPCWGGPSTTAQPSNRRCHHISCSSSKTELRTQATQRAFLEWTLQGVWLGLEMGVHLFWLGDANKPKRKFNNYRYSSVGSRVKHFPNIRGQSKNARGTRNATHIVFTGWSWNHESEWLCYIPTCFQHFFKIHCYFYVDVHCIYITT